MQQNPLFDASETPEEAIKRITDEHQVSLVQMRNHFEIQKLQIMQDIECKKLMIESVEADCVLQDLSSKRKVDSTFDSPLSSKRKIGSSVKSELIDLSDDENNSTKRYQKTTANKPIRKSKQDCMTVYQYCTDRNLPVNKAYITTITQRAKQTHLWKLCRKPVKNAQSVYLYPLSILESAVNNM